MLLFVVCAAFAAGIVDAIAGGGGLITLPALLAAGLPPHLALATNKGQSCFGAVSSAVSFWRRGGVDRERAPLAFFFGALGSATGSLTVLAVRPEPLRPVVLVLLLFAAVFVALPRGRRPADRVVASPRLVLAVIAFALGAYDGFFGPGAGSLLIVAFASVFGDPLTRASGNAKVVNLASNAAALAIFSVRARVAWDIALPMAAANAAGAFLGASLALRRGDRFVRSVVLCVVGAFTVKLLVDMLRG